MATLVSREAPRLRDIQGDRCDMAGGACCCYGPLRVLKCVLSNLHVSKCLCVLLCADRNILEALSPADRPAEGPTQLHGAAAEERPSFALQVYLLTRPSQATMTAHDY